MTFPSRKVLKRTAIVSCIAAFTSISISTGIRIITDTQSDNITILVRIILPFLIAIPLAFTWFSKFEKLENAYRAVSKQANEFAQHASTDPLTGLFNRRYFVKAYDHAMELGVSGWFIIADIDYLKMINDTYGHLAGDAAVISTANALQEVLPEDSLIARIGGDEFCAFVPGLSKEEIIALNEKITFVAGELYKKSVQDDQVRLSVSIGHILCKSNQTFTEVMALADEKLYRKKRMRPTLVT